MGEPRFSFQEPGHQCATFWDLAGSQLLLFEAVDPRNAVKIMAGPFPE